jgi:hypothetical protein
MSTLDQFLDSLRSKTAAPDMSLVVLRPRDTRDAIEEARTLGLTFLGLEGFRVFPQGGVQPVQDLSIDVWDYREAAEQDFLRDALGIVEANITTPDVAFELSFRDDRR